VKSEDADKMKFLEGANWMARRALESNNQA